MNRLIYNEGAMKVHCLANQIITFIIVENGINPKLSKMPKYPSIRSANHPSTAANIQCGCLLWIRIGIRVLLAIYIFSDPGKLFRVSGGATGE